MPKIKDDELRTLMAEVQEQLGTVLEGERDKLAKASPGEAISPEVPADTSATSPKDDGGSPEASAAPTDGGSPESSAEGTATGEETPGESTPGAPDADAPAGGEDPAAAGAEGDGEFVTDPQVLQAEYAKLPPEVLKAHYLACKAALWSVVGQDDGSAGAAPDAAAAPAAPAPDAAAAGAPPVPGADPTAGAAVPPPAPAPAPDASAAVPPPAASPSPSPDLPPPAQKAEMSINAEANGGKITKSEREAQLESELAKVQGLTKSLVELTTKLIQRPQRKAVTALSELGKSEPSTPTVNVESMTKSEIIARLNEKARGELKKSDRELINSFCVGSADVKQIAHLLA